jgi:hypothetical protein
MSDKEIKIVCNIRPDVEDALNDETPSTTHRHQSAEPMQKGEKNDGQDSTTD